jgi:predicted GNAT family acetyltransferase
VEGGVAMTAIGEHWWRYGIRCDHPGCNASLWRQGMSEQLAYTKAQEDAREAGWTVASDRLVGKQDLCREHRLWG